MSHQEGPLYGSQRELLGPLATRLADLGVLKWVIAITASLGAVLEIIDTSIVNVAMPHIQGNLGATLSEVGWVSTGYACANVIMIPLAAWLGSRFGRKSYLIFSLVGFTLSSAMCGLSTSLSMLIVARVLQGLCGGGLLAKAQSILFETFSREEQPAAQAIFGVGVIAGPVMGPVLGGFLTDTLGWRSIFFINLPIGIIAVLMTLVCLPRDVAEDKVETKVDWTGIALLAVGLGCLQTMLEEGQQEDWFSSRFIVTMAVGAAIALGLFIWNELKVAYPAVDLRVLRHRSLAAGSLYSLILGIGLYGVMFAVPIFVQDYLSFTAFQSGLLLLPGALASASGMLLMGKISGRFDPRFLIACGAMIMVSTALMLSQINPDTGTDSLFFPLLIRGMGSVMIFLPLSLATLGNLPKRDVAAGTGFYNLTRQLGSSVGIALITTMLARREGIHYAHLAEHVSAFRTVATDRLQHYQQLFQSLGSDPHTAQLQAHSLIERLLSSQAMLLSFADVFYYVAFIFVISLPLILLLGGRPRSAPVGAH
ncbi:MAG: emrB [Puniceicoccaceae bacterium 5H]|nr:MAG: emrB [Puniceicoccaceae bacterium 5H]